MKSKAIRFGVSADGRLLEKFDEMIAEKSYANRSEAIRDLIRDENPVSQFNIFIA